MAVCNNCKEEYYDESLGVCPVCGEPLYNNIITKELIKNVVTTKNHIEIKKEESSVEICKVPQPIFAIDIVLRDMFPHNPLERFSKILFVLASVTIILIWITPWSQKRLITFISNNSMVSKVESIKEDYMLEWGWTLLLKASKDRKLLLNYLIVVSLFFIILSVIPIPFHARAIASSFFSLTPIVLFNITPGYIVTFPFSFHRAYMSIGLFLLPLGLFYRKYYPTSIIARTFILIGNLLLFLFFLSPIGNSIVIFKVVSEMFDSTAEIIVNSSLYLFLILLMLLSLFALERYSRMYEELLSILFILWIPISGFVHSFFNLFYNKQLDLFLFKLYFLYFLFSFIAVISIFQLISLLTLFDLARYRELNLSKLLQFYTL